MDVWSEWSGAFLPFGFLVAKLFARRLQQFNVPLSPLETRLGTLSRVLVFSNPITGRRTFAAWVRKTVATDHTLYAGAYSVARLPGSSQPFVKVVFPLPNGFALVAMRPEAGADGSLTLHSAGRRFGDAGFYFYARPAAGGRGRARYLRSLHESIRVFIDEAGTLRADHVLKL